MKIIDRFVGKIQVINVALQKHRGFAFVFDRNPGKPIFCLEAEEA